jgi:glutathione peroxidase
MMKSISIPPTLTITYIRVELTFAIVSAIRMKFNVICFTCVPRQLVSQDRIHYSKHIMLPPEEENSMPSIYDFSVALPSGARQSLKAYEGRPMLIVNTASKCGFTPQFTGLQKLYTEFQDQGFVVLGFPCDQFRQQEFENIQETTEFCQLNFGVTFPIFAKIDVNGEKADPLFTYLKKQRRGILSSSIKWNFTKFLIDSQGRVVKRYSPTTVPEKIKTDVEKLLKR